MSSSERGQSVEAEQRQPRLSALAHVLALAHWPRAEDLKPILREARTRTAYEPRLIFVQPTTSGQVGGPRLSALIPPLAQAEGQCGSRLSALAHLAAPLFRLSLGTRVALASKSE